MLPTDVDRYVGEIARVLKKNARICASYSIITPESLQLMTSGNGSVHFKYNLGSYWISSKKVPELRVAYDERYLRGIYSKLGFLPAGHLLQTLSGLSTGLYLQDVVVATKL